MFLFENLNSSNHAKDVTVSSTVYSFYSPRRKVGISVYTLQCEVDNCRLLAFSFKNTPVFICSKFGVHVHTVILSTYHGSDLCRNTKADATHFQKIIIKTVIGGAYIAEKLLTLGLVLTNKIYVRRPYVFLFIYCAHDVHNVLRYKLQHSGLTHTFML